jgi:arylsulfatase A-like enzyme
MYFIVLSLLVMSFSSNNMIKKHPNVLLIAIDDLNDWVGYLGGHPQAQTPNIDRLIKKGVGFTKAYTVAPLCNPSRVALLTGLYPSTSGVYGNRNKFRENLPDAITLMQYFKENGYITKGGGKIFHQNNKPGDNKSWDEYFISKNITKGVGKDKSLPIVGTQKGWFNWGPLSEGDEEMQDAMTANWTISELEKNHDQSLFLACGFFRPHLPWYVPQKYFDRYPLEEIILPKTIIDDRDDLPEYGKRFARERYSASWGTDLNEGIQDHDLVLEYDQWQKGVQAYLASISFVDDYVGKIFDALERSIYADNTIVILWGDHGWHLGEKQHWRKQALWEDTTHVPFILSYPAEIAQNKMCNAPVSLIDIFPTLIDLSGLPEKGDLDGNSLVPLLKNPTMDWDRPVLTTYGKGNHAVRSGKWRYIQYQDGGSELYDHQKDPNEWYNLSDKEDHREVVVELKAHLPNQEK